MIRILPVVAVVLSTVGLPTAKSSDLNAQDYTVGDGTTQSVTFAGDGTGHYENGTVNLTLTIGANGGNGTVNVLSGASFDVPRSSWAHYIGYYDSGTVGTLHVSGPGSLASFVGLVNVGYIEANGIVTVDAGGRVESGTVRVAGAWTGLATPGQVEIDGSGSSWLNTDFFVGIGNNSNGELTISAGGNMQSTGIGYVGFGTGANGTATVSGINSRWDVDTDLTVGGRGDGSLDILDRGVVAAADVEIAAYNTSTSSVKVDGFNSRLEVVNDLMVGGELHGGTLRPGGTATLSVSDSAEVDVGGRLLMHAGATVDVGSNGKLWADEIVRFGGGTFNPMAGSSVYVNTLTGFPSSLSFGHQFALGHSGGIGQLDVPLGASLTADSNITIGEDEDSTATLQVAGTVSAPFVTLGAFDEAVGHVIVSGNTATLNATEVLSVGLNGVSILDEIAHGDLQITDGATVTTPEAYIGRFGGTGEVLVDNATFEAATTLEVGAGNQGLMVVQNGGMVTGTEVLVGASITSSGNVNLNSGGVIDVADVVVGVRGTGTMTLEGASTINAALVSVGDASSLTARESGTQINANSLSILAGGDVQFEDSAHAELLFAAVSGQLTVDDATVNIADSPAGGSLLIRGTVTVRNGGSIDSQRGDVGAVGLQDGSILIDGAGSRWSTHVDDRLFVGGFSNGTIQVTDGGGLHHAGDLFLGAADSATTGELSISGHDSTAYVAGDLSLSGGVIDGQPIDVLTTGVLTVDDHALLHVEGSVISFAGGTTTLAGGRFEAAEVDIASYGGEFHFTGGELAVDAFVGDLNNQGGTLTPGRSPGITSVTGDYLQEQNAALFIEIGGTESGEFDRVEIEGTAVLGGSLIVELVDTGDGLFDPQVGDSFGFLFANGEFAAEFDELVLPALDAGRDWRLNPGGATLFLEVVSSALAGDYNGDGLVDVADYTVWRDTLNSTGVGLAADGNGDMVVDNADYAVWRQNFGASAAQLASGESPVSVPEPSALLLVSLAVLAVSTTAVSRVSGNARAPVNRRTRRRGP